MAEELVNLFARVGIPQEILTDQGANFMSSLLVELYRLLKVKPHPQTDGHVERFNGTLKSMLRKAATEDWDKLIPYQLFAYREVPQASTGFSPFQLVYGRQVRGPLDVLKEEWKASKRASESVVSYVLEVHEKLEKMSVIVRQNLETAQKVQKTWYDKNVRQREFNEGDEVLVLLVKSEMDEMLKDGIVELIQSDWASPMVIVKRTETCASVVRYFGLIYIRYTLNYNESIVELNVRVSFVCLSIWYKFDQPSHSLIIVYGPSSRDGLKCQNKKVSHGRERYRASCTRVVREIRALLTSTDQNGTKMKQQKRFLEEKLTLLRGLDGEILELLRTEEELEAEIEQTDLCNEEISLAIAEVEEVLLQVNLQEDSTVDCEEQVRESSRPTSRAARTSVGGGETSLQRHSLSLEDVNSSMESRNPRVSRVKLPKLSFKKFGGDITSWSTFWDSFHSAVHSNEDLSNVDKFNYLISFLEGSAAECISGLTLTSANYEEAVAVLKRRFGNKQQIVNRHMEALLELEAVTSIHDIQPLRTLCDKIESHVRSLNSLGVPSSSYGSLLSSIVMNKCLRRSDLLLAGSLLIVNGALTNLSRLWRKRLTPGKGHLLLLVQQWLHHGNRKTGPLLHHFSLVNPHAVPTVEGLILQVAVAQLAV